MATYTGIATGATGASSSATKAPTGIKSTVVKPTLGQLWPRGTK